MLSSELTASEKMLNHKNLGCIKPNINELIIPTFDGSGTNNSPSLFFKVHVNTQYVIEMIICSINLPNF